MAELMDTILRARPHPEHGLRACLGLMRLAKRYEPERVVAACQRALHIGSTSYRSVNAIMKNGHDKVPLAIEPSAEIVPIQHANLRGADYHQQTLMESPSRHPSACECPARNSARKSRPLSLPPADDAWNGVAPIHKLCCACFPDGRNSRWCFRPPEPKL
ncbi:MAG: hypothetical protein M3069_00430 [Chloroflexota bacterium]|nr:hypothetical protein [Chloroflexota bacterium]